MSTNNLDYSQYQERFRNQLTEWKTQPLPGEQRKLNDKCCLYVFVIFTLLFFSIGGYYIYQMTQIKVSPFPKADDDEFQIGSYVGQFIACIVASLVVAFLYIFLLKTFPKPMVFTMIGLTMALLLAIAIGFISIGLIYGAVMVGIVMLIYGLILFCFWKKVLVGIILLKVTGNFMTDKPTVFLLPLIKMIFTIIFLAFWILSAGSILAVSIDQSPDNQFANFFAFIWVLFQLFYTFFFYYMMVFTIAVSCAFWYYRIDKSAISTAYGWMFKYHFGSLTFAAMLIAVITFVRMVVDDAKKNSKGCVKICLICMSCILKELEFLVKILNHNSIIVMSVTGQSFLDSASTTIGLLCQNLPLLIVSNLLCNFMVFWGMIFTAGIPTVLAFLLTTNANDLTRPSIIGLVFLGSIFFGSIVLGVLVESLASVYIFYCFDKRFKEIGVNSNNMPIEIYEQINNVHFDVPKDDQYNRQ